MTRIAQGKEPKLRQLFNGRDLAGWEHVGQGEIIVEAGLLKTRGGMGLHW